MLSRIRHVVHIVHNAVREHLKERKRSSRWPHVEKEFLLTHPFCEACHGDTRLNVHHIQPFHLHPELELNTSNLLTLCMGPHECHLRIGHGDSFKAYNPRVLDDAREVRKAPSTRSVVEARAKQTRLLA